MLKRAADELSGAAGFDPEIVEDVAEAPEDVSLPARNPALALQHMEAALTRADLEHPDILSRSEFRRLRYLISFARLTVFEPGAAGPYGRRGRGDVEVADEIAGFRALVLEKLHDPLRAELETAKRLIAAKELLESLGAELERERQAVAERHGNDFSLAELDREVGYKSLVCVLGGGGGAGYVYLGGMQRLTAEGLTPAYMLTTSFGAIVGSVMARATPVPMGDYIDWAKTVTYRGILGPARMRRRHGLSGLFSLNFDAFADDLFRRDDGERMRLADLDIPFDTVVAGIRRQSFDQLPARFRRSELDAVRSRTLPRTRAGIRSTVAARMWQAAAFIDSRVVKPIVLGGDDLTRELCVVDAASFSSAIPGVLHHETSDPAALPLLDEVLAQRDVAALIDGFAASNVPVELAWKRVQDGRIGTRNVCIYAWDCFHPQWNPKHLWLVPITQSVQVQMVRNAPYADRIVRFRPTLSALTLAASTEAMDRAIKWGTASIDESLNVIKHMLEPVWWDTKQVRPPEPEPAAQPPARTSRAKPMAAVLEAARVTAARLGEKALRNRTDLLARRP